MDKAENDWSMWQVADLGTLLLTRDRGHILVQKIGEIETGGEHVVAVSLSPSGRRTVLAGEGEHDEMFETALSNHLALLEIDRVAASRIVHSDFYGRSTPPRTAGVKP